MTTHSDLIATIDTFRDDYLIKGIQADYAQGKIVEAMKREPTPTLAQYEEAREHFMAELPDDVTPDAARKRWQRLTDAANWERPKSETKAATDTATKRQQERDRLAALSLDEVEKCMTTSKADNDFKAAAKYQAELKRRADDLLKPELDARKSEAKAIKELVTDKLPLAKLKAIHEAIEKIVKS